MHINRIVLAEAKVFSSFDQTLRRDWVDEPLSSILLTGPNGSGKTTLLRIISALWENFGHWLRLEKSLNREQQAQGGLLTQTSLAAIEIRDWLDRPLWLFTAASPQYREELAERVGREDVYYVGETRGARGRPPFEPGRDVGWFREINAQKLRLELGVDAADPLPNMLFLEADKRVMVAPGKRHTEISSEPLFRWHTVYEAQERGDSNIETMLRNLKIRDTDAFNSVIKDINSFFDTNKRITDFNDNLRLQVQIDNGSRIVHTLDDLSAGEHQCLILIFMVSRWLMDGGVALIDEPDLHLHVSLQRQLVHHLEQLVLSKRGQLIVTSHSPTLWEEYHAEQRVELAQVVYE
jgi:ABC-type transport system involved in cytochrome c biogenesis ATPase subunit